MASVNKVILLGNLGQDPQIRDANGKVLANLNLATTRKYKDASGQWVSETEWHRVTFFGRTAEVCRDYLHKGSSAYIEGRLRTRKFVGKDGTEKAVTEIVGETLQLLNSPREGGAQPSQVARQPANFESSARPRQTVSRDYLSDDETPF